MEDEADIEGGLFSALTDAVCELFLPPELEETGPEHLLSTGSEEELVALVPTSEETGSEFLFSLPALVFMHLATDEVPLQLANLLVAEGPPRAAEV